MEIELNKKIWIYVERLYIDSYGTEGFIKFLKKFNIDYSNPIYNKISEFPKGKDINEVKYEFMSKENYDFAYFIDKYPFDMKLKILNDIIFDKGILKNKETGWNYWGEQVSEWYKKIIEFLSLADLKINDNDQKIDVSEETIEEEKTNEAIRDITFLKYKFNDPFLDHIVKELNDCYKIEKYLATMILSRKLLECIFVRILENLFPKLSKGEYKKENHLLWYDINHNRYHNFDKLISNLKENSSEFDEDASLIKEICEMVKPFKDETNECIHKDYKIPDKEYIKGWRIDQLIYRARRVYLKYCPSGNEINDINSEKDLVF